jgi:hypothetical protein
MTLAAQLSKMINFRAESTESHTSRPFAVPFTLDASAQDSQQHKDFDPDMKTEVVTSTG